MTKQTSLFTAILATLGMTMSGADLAPGTPAPAFSAQDQNGKTISLADFQGKAVVVLYFYPKDDTPGCTKEACSLRDGFTEIQKVGAVILGVSADDVKSHAAFAEKFKLPFSILADPDHRRLRRADARGGLRQAGHLHHRQGRSHPEHRPGGQGRGARQAGSGSIKELAGLGWRGSCPLAPTHHAPYKRWGSLRN